MQVNNRRKAYNDVLIKANGLNSKCISPIYVVMNHASMHSSVRGLLMIRKIHLCKHHKIYTLIHESCDMTQKYAKCARNMV